MEEVGGGAEVMDRTAGVRICGESRFRELEDEYLQKQARIWLSEVLKRRLDDDQCISDMLADGDLLFETSNVLWKLLKEKGVEEENLRIFSRTTKSKKHSGKYMPYSNVDAFLKICKLMGLTGVDLFSPSDVVERRDTRKVCLCIRSLSKKARSLNIHVPDFDVVTCTITMPTNLIGCIRKSLELSRCGSVSSDTFNSGNESDFLSLKANYIASFENSYDLHSEVSDDADSSVSVGYYRPFSKVSSDTALLRKSDSSSSIESFSLFNDNNLEEALAHFGVCEHGTDKHEVMVVDSSASPSFSNQMKSDDSDRTSCLIQNPHDSGSGVQDLRISSITAEIFLDENIIGKTGTKISSPVSDLECHGYQFFCNEKLSKCADLLSEGSISSQMHDERDLRYNESCLSTSCNRHTNVLNFDFDDTHSEDDMESHYGIVLNPESNNVNKFGKVRSDSSDMVREFVVYSDRLDSKMISMENGLSVSCLDFQSHARGSGDTETSDCDVHLSSRATSGYGDGEAELLHELKDWSVENEDLENVHMSIIESFLAATTCSKTEPNICSDKWDESDCWNLDGDDLKPVQPIQACEHFPHFVNESSCDDKFVEDKGVIGCTDEVDLVNFFYGTKDSSCDQETSDKVPKGYSTNDMEFYGPDSPLSQIPPDMAGENQDKDECSEAKFTEAEVLVPKDSETSKFNQSKTGKSPILKSIMGGATLLALGILAFLLNTRTTKKDETKKPQSEHSHISGENKFSSPKTSNGVVKKGVYDAGKLKFS